MPWLALPFGDARKSSLSRRFKVKWPNSYTRSKDLIKMHRVKAYPFTEERLKEIEAEYEKMAKEWPEKVKYHWDDKLELTLSRMMDYECDQCNEHGRVWAFRCKESDINLHPKCALEEVNLTESEDGETEGESVDEKSPTESESMDEESPTEGESMDEESPNEGWVCGGNMSTGFCCSSSLSRGRQTSVYFGYPI
ncbi:hypothetical protein SLE2022_323260 [Rubroshorea leprosula]